MLRFASESTPIHPTQKPVDLVRCLVRTYSNPGETVLDCCMGSASTGHACVLEGRQFIGVEKDANHFEAGKSRMDKAVRDGAAPN